MQSKTIIRFDCDEKPHKILKRFFDNGYVWEDELPIFFPIAKATFSHDTWHLKPYLEKEAPTMKVEYNGFTGELVKLERKDLRVFGVDVDGSTYSLVIEDKGKHVKHDFDNVKLEDVKFLGGAVAFGG